MTTNTFEVPPAITGLVADFRHLPSWETRFSYLIELGNELPRLTHEANCDAVCFRGCQSSVWVQTSLEVESDCPKLHFLADSDSKIVRGLLAVLHRVYSGQPADFILNYDVNQLFCELELDQHLTAGRRNGLYDMEMHIKGIARNYA